MAERRRGPFPTGWVRDLREHRAGPVVLISALLVLIFAASVTTGYTVSRPLNDDGGAVLAKGNTVAYVNGESARVEAEARALVSGKQPLETATLSDGRVAVVSNTSKQVWLIDPATMTPQGAPVDRGDGRPGPDESPTPDQDDHLAVVAGPQHSYLIDTNAGTVEEIDPQGAPRTPVQVPGETTTTAVPDGSDGVWVLTGDAMVVYVRGGQVHRRVDTGGRVEHLTLADGRPIAITDSGMLLDVAADPVRRIADEPVPHGLNVAVGSAKGAGRWVLIVDRRAGELIVVDPRTGTRRVFADLPTDPSRHNLGAPVVVGDRVYVPDHAAHKLYVRNARTGEVGADIEVPGRSPLISLEVRGEKVWANDQHDRRAVVIGPDGHHRTVDKGTGQELTDTTMFGTVPGAAAGTETDPASPRPEPVRPAEPPRSPPPARVPPLIAEPPLPAVVEPESEPDPRNAPSAPEQVSVPEIRPGTDKDEACRRIEDAGLLCATVAAGSDGPTDEVIDTDPPGGTRVPRGYRVTVRHYGPTTVPDVVGRFSADACGQIEASRLHCASEPNPEIAPTPDRLDVVSVQDPGAGTAVSAGSAVTVRYWDRALLGDYRGHPGAEACAEAKATYRRVECTVTEGAATVAQTGQPAGTVYEQSPAPDTAIRMGETVTLTVVKGSAQVPDVRGMSQADACSTLAAAGYSCDARADAIARHAVVTAQDTAPGTPMDGGSVVIHYAPYEPVLLRLYQSDTGERVYIIRPDGQPHERYSRPGNVLGYGYPHNWDQPGTVMVWDHYCTSDKDTCLGWSTNHYQSRDNKPFHDKWRGPNEMVRFIAPTGSEQCAPGQVLMYRYANFKGRDRDYIVASPTPDGYPSYKEFLGCLWSP